MTAVESSSARVDAADVWGELHGALLAFISRRVRDRDAAEDILQDVMLRIHTYAGDVEQSAVGAWVYRIARNAIIDHYRSAAVRRELPWGIAPGGPVPLTVEPASADLRHELAACLGPLLERLPASQREALVLTEFCGLTQVAAAARLGVSASGVKSRVQRARSALRDVLMTCCEVELDRRAGVIDYRPRGDGCSCCSPGP